VMNTGTGKTLIAVLLCKHILSLEYERKKAGERDYLTHQIDEAVLPLCGPKMPENCGEAEWERLVSGQAVICSTPQVILCALNAGFLKMSQIALIVFDEAHNAIGNHPYCGIMREHYARVDKESRPKVLGLTASPVNSARDIEKCINDLEKTLNSKVASVVIPDSENRHVQKPRQLVYTSYEPTEFPPLYAPLKERYATFGEIDPREFEKAADLLKDLGPWSAWRFLWAVVVGAQKKLDAFVGANTAWSNNRASTLGPDGAPSAFDPAPAPPLLPELFRNFTPPDAPLRENFSPKVQVLVKFLKSKLVGADSATIFVQRRITAEWLADALRQHPDLVGIARVGVLMGINDDGAVSQVSTNVVDQVHTTRKFRRGELNVVVATK
ncbi:P-loop containing nucleoside triphosphate hydrolase protein, partial [Blyttiomyces helicus]